MFRTAAAEVRTTKPASLHDVRDHFFYDGLAIGAHIGTHRVGKMEGTVKILPLANGKWSLRSIGREGNGALIHTYGATKVVADGIVTTVESHYWRIQRNA